MIFEEVARDSHPHEIGEDRLVCKEWAEIINNKKIVIEKEKVFKYSDLGDMSVWKNCIHAWYGVTGHEEFLEQFLSGKLVYKPNEGNDEGKIELKISDLPNPFAGKFDLSKCGDADNYLAIMTGFREKRMEANKDKVEVWVTPWDLIEKFKENKAKHFAPILEKWDEKTHPIALFYTWGHWENLSWYEYLTNKTPAQLSENNLYKNWLRSHSDHPLGFPCPLPVIASRAHLITLHF